MGERQELVPGGRGSQVPDVAVCPSFSPSGQQAASARSGGAGGCLRCTARDSEGWSPPRPAHGPSPPVV